MLAHVLDIANAFLHPAVFDDDTPPMIRNSYLVSSAMAVIVMPLLVLFSVFAPQLTPLSAPIGIVLMFISVTAILLIRAGRFATATIPALTMLGWAALTWAAWETGGLYSPALYAQFFLVVLAELCNGWRWSLVSLSASTLTIVAFGWAEVAGITQPSHIAMPPMLFVAIAVAFLVSLAGLEALIVYQMRQMQAKVSTELEVRRAADERLQHVIGNAPFGALVCEIRDGDLIVAHMNRSAGVLLGTGADAFLGHPIADVFPLADAGMMAGYRRVAEQGGTHDVGMMPFFAVGRSGALDVHSFQVGPNSMAAFFTDVTEKRAAEVEINRMAFTDDLTDLPNRSLLHRQLSAALVNAHSHASHVALLFIDLDNFKPVNDMYGHHVGDLLLVEVGRRLQNCSRASDTVARLGGDEFTIIVADIRSRAQAEVVARKAVESFREPFVIDGHTIKVTASVGVAVTSNGDSGLDSLLEHSDKAMYQAKQAGRNGYSLYESSAA